MEEILNILGNNHTKPCWVDLNNNEYIGVYTDGGDIFVLKNKLDYRFSGVSEDDQFILSYNIMINNYEVDSTFQGYPSFK